MSDGADASGAAPQIMAAPWAMLGLHNATYRERCTATVADTLVKDDEDGRWLFTSKRGEVQRKKRTSPAQQAKMIQERFVRLGLMGDGNPEGFVCCVRRADGGFKFLGERGFAKLGGALPAEPDVVGIQAYVHGNYYRNAYERPQGTGRIKTATVVVPTRPDDSKFSQHGADGPAFVDGPDGEKCINVPGKRLRAYGKSRATTLNETLDAATRSLVRFLEKTQHCRVAKLTADYVVDGRNQLWLVWLGDCTHIPVEVRPASSRPTDKATAPSIVDGAALEQVMDVTSRVDTTSRGERRRKRDELKAGAPVTSEDEARQWSVKFGSATPKSPEIPKNQRCVGDYCHVQIHDPKQLFTEEEMRAFTGSDVDALRSLVRDTYAEGPTTEVAFRSIYLAGREKRGFKEGQERRDDDELPEWMRFPEDPSDQQLADAIALAREDVEEPSDDDEMVPRESESAAGVERRRARRRENQAQGLTADTDASRARRDWRAQRGELEGGTANMYKRCRVCAHCASMYALLDKGREILAKDASADEAEARKKARAERRALVQFAEEPEQPDAATGFRDALARRVGTPAAAAETRVVEAPQQVKRPPPVKNHKSWKGRLPEAELYGADAPASVLDQNQNEKFEKLDEYLRGTSDAAARKAEARAAALARSRAAQLKLAREEGCESSDLYFGRVLVVEARGSADLPDCVETLEGAGFVVDVELDVQHAREMLAAAHGVDAAPGWQYDAILVSDVLDLGDAFDVVGEVRDLEKQRRKRESAKQVAKAKRAAAKPGGMNDDNDRLKPGTFIHLPVVVLSARTAPEDLRAYKAAGLDGCISRPLQKAALLSTLRAAVPRHGRQLLGDLAQPKRGAQPAQGEPARDRGSNAAFVSWSVRLTGLEPDDFDQGTRNAFCAEAATQLGLGVDRVEILEVTAGSAILSLRSHGLRERRGRAGLWAGAARAVAARRRGELGPPFDRRDRDHGVDGPGRGRAREALGRARGGGRRRRRDGQRGARGQEPEPAGVVHGRRRLGRRRAAARRGHVLALCRRGLFAVERRETTGPGGRAPGDVQPGRVPRLLRHVREAEDRADAHRRALPGPAGAVVELPGPGLYGVARGAAPEQHLPGVVPLGAPDARRQPGHEAVRRHEALLPAGLRLRRVGGELLRDALPAAGDARPRAVQRLQFRRPAPRGRAPRRHERLQLRAAVAAGPAGLLLVEVPLQSGLPDESVHTISAELVHGGPQPDHAGGPHAVVRGRAREPRRAARAVLARTCPASPCTRRRACS